MDTETRVRDGWLALRCQTNEPGAYEDLVAVLEMPLLYYAMKLAGNRDAALDILQEAWIRALRGIGKLREPESVRPWLYSIVHGLAVDHVRHAKVRERVETPGYEDAEIAENESESFRANDAAAIHAALDRLEPRHREVLILHFLEEFSIAQIAEVTGCPEGTVKSRLHHAKKAMRTILTGGTYATKS